MIQVQTSAAVRDLALDTLEPLTEPEGTATLIDVEDALEKIGNTEVDGHYGDDLGEDNEIAYELLRLLRLAETEKAGFLYLY